MSWSSIAKFCARPAVADWLIARSKKTPYCPIMKNGQTYMDRHWLFNPYNLGKRNLWQRLMAHLPSVRVHHIQLPDTDRHLHSHPWDCRTIILRGQYEEKRLMRLRMPDDFTSALAVERRPGDTATLDINDYHSIEKISEGGVWTLFITWKYQGTWGFLVDGKKVPYRTYLGLD